MSRRSSVIEDPKSASLSRSSSAASHLSRWSKAKTEAATTPPGSRRGSLDTHSHASDPNHPSEAGSFKGHPGHLSPEQEGKLAQFKVELTKLGIFDKDGGEDDSVGKGKGNISDTTLL